MAGGEENGSVQLRRLDRRQPGGARAPTGADSPGFSAGLNSIYMRISGLTFTELITPGQMLAVPAHAPTGHSISAWGETPGNLHKQPSPEEAHQTSGLA